MGTGEISEENFFYTEFFKLDERSKMKLFYLDFTAQRLYRFSLQHVGDKVQRGNKKTSPKFLLAQLETAKFKIAATAEGQSRVARQVMRVSLKIPMNASNKGGKIWLQRKHG